MKLVYVRTIFLSCMVGFENNLVQMIIMAKMCHEQELSMSLGQRSMSQSALKLCA